MGRPYSTDLRERVLRACEVGDESQAAIARRFAISESAVGSWLRQLRREGRRAPKPHGRGFRSILDEDDAAVLRALVAPARAGRGEERCDPGGIHPGLYRPDRSGDQCIQRLPGTAASRVGDQKKTLRASEQLRPDVAAEREDFAQAMAAVDPN